ncbi:MAG TPA: M14 family zinc carboxypeptidase [Terriglobia bacterium]|nr:M14 family zinc carboxypeptidase [Terriglobia bacterium]
MRSLLISLVLLILEFANGYSQSPHAIVGSDVSVVLGQPVHLDGSRSSAATGHRIVAWSWDLDNSDAIRGDYQGPEITHYYNYVGSYTATLTVTDDMGQTDQAYQRIEVRSPEAWGMTLVDRFEGGRSGVISRSSADFTISNQWGLQWYFRLDNIANVPVSIKIYGYGPNRKVPTYVTPYEDDQSFDEKFIPYVNYDFSNPHWTRLQGAELTYDPQTCSLIIRHTFPSSPVYLAWSPPYVPSDLDRFLRTVAGNRYCQVKTLGQSVEGRDLKMITITDPGVANARKNVVWMIGQQHAYEMVGGPICEGIVNALLVGNAPNPVLAKFVFNLVPIVNPDAIAHGGFRYNMHDVDLNRNWDDIAEGYADRTRPEPEVEAIQKALSHWVGEGNRLDLFVDLHCHTPLSEGLWLYPADATLVNGTVYGRQLKFAQAFMNRNYEFAINPAKTPGSAMWYAAARFSGKTGVLAYTSENPLLAIRTANKERVLTTPDLYRAIGQDWVRAIVEFFK